MNETNIVVLRQDRGWTQEKLAAESGVGIRTIQRLESGLDASLETLSLVANAFGVPVRALFRTIENDSFSSLIDSLEGRTQDQQARRNRINGAWLWFFIGVGVVVSMISFVIAGQIGGALFLGYWGGGLLILVAARRLYLDSRLDEKYPLSRSKHQLRAYRRLQDDTSPDER